MMLPRERPEVRSSRLLFLCYDCYYYHYHSAVSRNSRFIVVVIHQGVQLFVQILPHPRAAQLHSMQLQEKTSKMAAEPLVRRLTIWAFMHLSAA